MMYREPSREIPVIENTGVVVLGSGPAGIGAALAAAKAGVPYQTGRPSDGHMQPMTLMCKVGGVEMERVHFIGAFEDTYACHGSDIQTLARQHLPHPAGHLLIYKNALPGVVTCNMTNAIHVDGTSAEDLTKATVTCRSQLEPIVQFLRTYVDGFENCYLIQAASMIGVRETRHFEGAYCLNEQDILDSRVFDDWVVTGCRFNFDVHSLSGAGLDETGLQKYFPETIGYTIPYRSLLPKGVENLLLAGRNICGTHIAHSSFRVMPICLGTGEAAGTAAALSLQTGVPVKELDVSSIQQKINPAFFRERAAASH